MERIEAVEALGIADQILVEEYEGQKIDDIKKFDVDIFTVGSDWVGKFDYLEEYCKVVYLPRTEGVSSSDLRGSKRAVNLGLVGDSKFLKKVYAESKFVNWNSYSGNLRPKSRFVFRYCRGRRAAYLGLSGAFGTGGRGVYPIAAGGSL